MRDAKQDTFNDVMTRMYERFLSGNEIAVERAHITLKEWLLITDRISELEADVERLGRWDR